MKYSLLHPRARRLRSLFQVLVAFAFISAASVSSAQVIRYVDADNTTENQDGLSWATAFCTIQPAIDSAHAEGGGDIWVADGVYTEDRPDSGTLIVRENCRLLAGFVGIETNEDERIPRHRATIIGRHQSWENIPAYTAYTRSNSCIDGFTFTNTYSEDAQRAAIRNYGNDVLIANCWVSDQLWAGAAGVLSRKPEGIELRKCVFSNNTITNGPIASESSTCVLIGYRIVVSECIFADNFAQHAGALTLDTGLSGSRLVKTVVSRCVFSNNTAVLVPSSVGAVNARGDTGILNCLFVGNFGQYSALKQNGGIGFVLNCSFIHNRQSLPFTFQTVSVGSEGAVFMNCLFADNTEELVYRGMRRTQIPPIFIHCRFDPESQPSNPDDIVINPLFAEPTYVNPITGDFAPRFGSPVIDAGAESITVQLGDEEIEVVAPETDFNGNPRPVGSAPDIGAFEFDPSTFVDPFDVSGDTRVDAEDIQAAINQLLNGTGNAFDFDGDLATTAADVQLLINRVLELF